MRMVGRAKLKDFWYWIEERHQIWRRRNWGQPKPWTNDPILQRYKFTNVFRELDTGTVWLRQNFIEKHPDGGATLLFNIAWYRLFNRVETGNVLRYLTVFRAGEVRRKLKARKRDGFPVFTSAHMTHGRKGQDKIDTFIESMADLWKDRTTIYAAVCGQATLEHAFSVLRQYQSIGDFVAYEIVTDLRHTNMLHNAPDINTWANPGPGALRGLRRLSKNPDISISSEEGLARMIELLGLSKTTLPGDFPKLELRDVEHVLCETDKYFRVKFGEGRPRQTYPGQEGGN